MFNFGKIKWLDELPSQSVLDGLEPLPLLFGSKNELAPKIIETFPTLPTYVPYVSEYEQELLNEYGLY